MISPIAICLQETYSINDKDMLEIKDMFKNFHFYFKCRDRIGQHNPGGGVAIMINKEVPHTHRLINTELEAISVDIKFRSKLISICSLYLPPNRNFTTQSLKILSDQLLDHHLILGDFNAHNVSWGSLQTDNKGTLVSDFINITNNVLLNSGDPTRVCPTTGNFSHIDLSLATPRLSLDIEWATFTDTLGSDHFPIILTLNAVNMCDENFTPLCKYKCTDVGWESYSTQASLSIQGENVSDMYINIKTSILSAAESTLPKLPTKRTRILVPWWKPECKEILRIRNNAYRRYLRYPTVENFTAYKKYRAFARLVIKSAKRLAWRDFVSKITKDTPVKEIWKYIKRINGSKHASGPVCIVVNDVIIDDPKLIAEEIAKYFESVSADSNYSNEFLSNQDHLNQPLDFSTNNKLDYNEDFTIGELLFVLGKVRGSSAGPDGIRYEMLQNLSPLNKIVLLEFFNTIWRTQSFPEDWTNAITIPILKPGKESKHTSSYRPIALTNVLCKIMERLVNKRLCDFLEENEYLHPMQSGFRKGRNTLHNLLHLEHDVKLSLSDNNFTVAIFLDIEKAFDMCPRKGILKKMHEMGLRGNLPIFIKNFLTTRNFQVKVKNKFSSIHVQQNGVPQGSVLSPTLFIILINDILGNPPPGIKISLYADDVAIWISAQELNTCFSNLQIALNRLEIWSGLWGLRFSAQKTKAVIFKPPTLTTSLRYRNHPKVLTLYGVQIEIVPYYKFLGLIFDSSLTWVHHLNALKEALNSRINVLKAISGSDWGADRSTSLMLYRNMIRPKLEYGCILYASSATTNLNSLEVIQNRCLKIATGVFKSVKTEILEVEAGIYPLRHHFTKVISNFAATKPSTMNIH